MTLLKWLERALLVAGVGTAVWCAAILLEARRTRQLPIEPVHVTMTLPGDESSGSSGSRAAGGGEGTSVRHSAPAPGTVIGRLEAPTLHLSTPVLEGSADGTLARGAGHIEDTPFPGEDGNVGIAGHRDTVFRPLRRAKAGDELRLTTADHVYRYRIAKTSIVDPDDVYVLDPTDEPTLTLVTCYPFQYIGHAPRRFIVQATLEDVRDTTNTKEDKGHEGGQ